jgi:Flp pilus assembly protein TadG
MKAPGREGRRRGHAMVEVALLSPWIFFLFAGAFDMGFYSHALISATNAARAGALHASGDAATAGDSAGACAFALAELRSMPNVRTLTSCAALPLIVTATPVTGIDGAPATEVRVVYQTPMMFPIPGLPGQLTLTRTAQMRVQEF